MAELVPQQTHRSQSGLAALALLGVAAAWGLSFPLTKQLVADLPATDLMALRYVGAAAVSTLVLFRWLRALDRTMVRRGILLGGTYGLAGILQAEGLAYTSASVSGFITGMYVVLTPLCGLLLLKTRILPIWWWGAGLATLGLGLMSLNGLSVGVGELLTLGCALLYALHIVGLGQWSTHREALGLSVVQLISAAVVCAVAAIPGGVVLPTTGGEWASIGYLVVVSGAVAMIAQSWSQAHLPAPRAAVIMVTEPVWAAVLAIGLFGEPLGWRIAVGGALMLAAMLLVELPSQSRSSSSPAHRAGDPPHAEEIPRLPS